MLKALEKMVERVEGDYLTPVDLAALQTYHAGFSKRLQAYKNLQKLEAELVIETVRRLQLAEPELLKPFKAQHDTKCVRDVTLVLRQCALAMLLDDRDYLYDHFLHWLKTIMVSLNHQQIHQRMFATLQTVVSEKLPQNQAELLNRYLAYAASVIG